MTRVQNERTGFACFAIAAATLIVAAPTPSAAAGLTSVMDDAIGDAVVTVNGTAVAAYQDIVQASVALSDGQFVLTMDVAAPIPDRPELPNGGRLLEWSFRLRTDLETCASGYPYPPAATLTSPEVTHCAQFMIFVVSDGTGFTGMLIDRTPSLAGEPAVVTPISFSVIGTEITASIEAGLVGNPQAFRWISRTETWFGKLGSMGYAVVDAAPDEGLFAVWPK
jgi:hypothetical protein